jgi:hypothetical protein
MKEHSSDLQTFLSLPHLISKAKVEEKNVEKVGSEGSMQYNCTQRKVRSRYLR